jgi:hypothetical protein
MTTVFILWIRISITTVKKILVWTSREAFHNLHSIPLKKASITLTIPQFKYRNIRDDVLYNKSSSNNDFLVAPPCPLFVAVGS